MYDNFIQEINITPYRVLFRLIHNSLINILEFITRAVSPRLKASPRFSVLASSEDGNGKGERGEKKGRGERSDVKRIFFYVRVGEFLS